MKTRLYSQGDVFPEACIGILSEKKSLSLLSGHFRPTAWTRKVTSLCDCTKTNSVCLFLKPKYNE
jgi:hypothetical protein